MRSFIARHGSWNKSQKQGGDIVVVKLNKDGTVKSMEPFLTGFLEDNKYVGRPVDVMQLKTDRCWSPTTGTAPSTASATASRRSRRSKSPRP